MKKTSTSLTFKLGLAIFIVTSISFFGLGIYYTKLFSQQIDQQLFAQARIPGRLMNQQALPYNTSRDLSSLSRLIGEKVVYASVSRRDHLIYYCSEPARERTYIDTSKEPRSIPGTTTETIVSRRPGTGEAYLAISTPLFSDSKYLGNLYQEIDTRNSVAEKKRNAAIFFCGGLFCVVLTTLAGAFLIRKLTLPRITASIECLRMAAAGNYSARIKNIKSQDELGMLERGINHMIQHLDERQGEDDRLRKKRNGQRP
jgi:methyl-accepting chemotaxis protein